MPVLSNKSDFLQRFWRDIKRNSPNELIPLKPGAVSKWIFPVYAMILLLAGSIVWVIHHPELIKAGGVIMEANASGNLLWAEVDLQKNQIEKIAPGKPVQLQFAEYPAARYGKLSGVVHEVRRIPASQKALIQVFLPNGSITGRKETIPYKKGARVDLLITVKDMRLLDRILSRPSF